MEYYAKSPIPVLQEESRQCLLERLDEALVVFESQPDQDSYKLLHKYREKLLTKQAVIEHKTLRQHLEETTACADNFFRLYGKYFSEKEKMLIMDACRLHDVGKANYVFQTKVNPFLEKVKKEQVPHGFLSALLLSEKNYLRDNPQCDRDDFDVLLTAVYYHHTRPDCCDADALKEYCEKYYLNHVREFLGDAEARVFFSNRNELLFSDRHEKGTVAIDEKLWCEYMLVKGMLNKFDWTVSAGYENAEIAPDILEKRLCQNIEKVWGKSFRPAQQFMIENRERNVVMVAPTGSGKTEAALLWFNGEKGFYTLPLKVSSNAIYQRIREKYQYEDVALLHSDSMNSYLRADGELANAYRNYEQAKLFSCPLTVCTVDQLFKFVYKALGTEIFAATLKYSKVVIDEIQSYSPRVVASLIFGLSELKRMGGRFAIITATFPPVLQFFMRKSRLVEGRDYVWHDFSDTAVVNRHRIKLVEGDFDFEEMAEAAQNKKVLVICNTVLKAQNVYRELKDRGLEAGLLHSHFIREHRNILEKRIMDFSAAESESGIWVTTQIVEASLDIDFDILYTEMCTADSLLQRMGRCNRAGKKNVSDPNVYIYHNDSGRGSVYDKDIYDRSVALLKMFDDKLLSEADKVEYINQVYDLEYIKGTQYFQQIEKYIDHFKTLLPAEYDAREVQEEFRAIQSITVMPDTIYDQNREVIQSIAGLLETPHIDTGIRKLLKSRLADMTLSLSITYGIPDGIDKCTIGLFDIHRTALCYDFDGESGLGLVLGKVEEGINFL